LSSGRRVWWPGWGRSWRVVRDTILGFNQDQGFRLAAALAFYTALSLGPMVVILLMIVGRVYGPEAAAEHLKTEVQEQVGGPAAEALIRIIEQARAPGEQGLALVVSLSVLLFSATAVFAQLQDAMNVIWNVPRNRPRVWLIMIRTRVLALFMLLVLTAIAAGLVVLSYALDFTLRTSIGFLPDGIAPDLKAVSRVVDWGVSLLVFTALFLVIFKLVPEAEIPWRESVVGAVVTALLFALGRDLISFVLSRSQPSSAYGAAGSIIVVLLWVYYSSVLLFLGAEFTQSLARERGVAPTPNKLLPEPETPEPTGPVGGA
jgi:membrane protein